MGIASARRCKELMLRNSCYIKTKLRVKRPVYFRTRRAYLNYELNATYTVGMAMVVFLNLQAALKIDSLTADYFNPPLETTIY